ncbi:MAG TPA: serine/threonine-protein kinase [Vicinamibacterales bacterium]|jgi:serine/threonine protein kinase
MTTRVPAPIAVIAHYNLLERLDPAGPGELFRARDTKKGRTVAVRVLPERFVDASELPDFMERARGLFALSHPNVTTVFDVGEHEGRIYIVFEFLKGQSLRSEMGGRAINVRRAMDLAVQMADAVADAHACGYVHGGLSPESVVITAKGHAKIPAFALASREGFAGPDAEHLHDYDSPEEARGLPSDERSDIYSVGAVLYEMLTGRRPLHRGASAPSANNPHVPREVDDIVLKAVAPNPDSRYQSSATFAAELRSIGAMLDVRGTIGDDEDEPPKAPSHNVTRTLVLTIVMLLVIAAIAWWFLR